MRRVTITAARRDDIIKGLLKTLAVLDGPENPLLGDPGAIERRRREDAEMDARIAARRAAVQL